MRNIGDKIRGIRTLKGFSQENVAEMLNLSLPAYADIERGKKDVTIKRLEQIADRLGVNLSDILTFGDKISNFFDQCSSVVAGINNGGLNNYDTRELQHQVEKILLEKEKLKAEKEKAELEAKYWKEKYEKKI